MRTGYYASILGHLSPAPDLAGYPGTLGDTIGFPGRDVGCMPGSVHTTCHLLLLAMARQVL